MPDTTAAAADTAAATPPADTADTATPPDTGTPAPPAAAPPPAPAQPDPAPADADTAVDSALAAELAKAKADADKWKGLAQKHEGRAKANADAAKELEALRVANLSDQERIVEEAKAAARAEVIGEFGGALVRSEFRVATAGRMEPAALDALLEHLDLSRFIDEAGQPKADEVSKFIDTVAPKVEPAPAATPAADAAPDQPTPATPATPPALAPLVDTGQGAGRSDPLALNGDPIEKTIRNLVGAPRR